MEGPLHAETVVSRHFDSELISCTLFRYTPLDIECIHGDPPDMANHRNTEQMFPGFYHGWRVPCTPKPSSHATLTLNSFRVRSYDFSPRLKPGVSWVRTKQETQNALTTPLAPPFLPLHKVRGI